MRPKADRILDYTYSPGKCAQEVLKYFQTDPDHTIIGGINDPSAFDVWACASLQKDANPFIRLIGDLFYRQEIEYGKYYRVSAEILKYLLPALRLEDRDMFDSDINKRLRDIREYVENNKKEYLVYDTPLEDYFPEEVLSLMDNATVEILSDERIIPGKWEKNTFKNRNMFRVKYKEEIGVDKSCLAIVVPPDLKGNFNKENTARLLGRVMKGTNMDLVIVCTSRKGMMARFAKANKNIHYIELENDIPQWDNYQDLKDLFGQKADFTLDFQQEDAGVIGPWRVMDKIFEVEQYDMEAQRRLKAKLQQEIEDEPSIPRKEVFSRRLLQLTASKTLIGASNGTALYLYHELKALSHLVSEMNEIYALSEEIDTKKFALREKTLIPASIFDEFITTALSFINTLYRSALVKDYTPIDQRVGYYSSEGGKVMHS